MKGSTTNTSSMSDRGSGRPDDRSESSGHPTTNASFRNTDAGNTGFSSGQISPQTHNSANRSGSNSRSGNSNSHSDSKLHRSGDQNR